MIRKFKPNNILEIGSGFSTKMILNGISKNKDDDINYTCSLKCIEPYEYLPLEKLKVDVIKERVEKVDIKLYDELKENDILLIDSSHIIRPQGDVLFELQNIIPSLNKGVLIHFHDISAK